MSWLLMQYITNQVAIQAMYLDKGGAAPARNDKPFDAF